MLNSGEVLLNNIYINIDIIQLVTEFKLIFLKTDNYSFPILNEYNS